MSPEKTTLTVKQRQTLETHGLVRLPGAVPRSDAQAMADVLWDGLARKYHIRKDDPATWSVERPSGLNRILPRGAFSRMASPVVAGAMDDLLGAWERPSNWGPPLLAFPAGSRDWTAPHQSWHLDYPAEPGRRGLSRVGRVFVVLAPLEPRSGGTLIAQGTHQLAEAEAERATRTLTSAEVRERLSRRVLWVQDLQSPVGGADRIRRFMDETTHVDGAPLRVVEMTGEPGDVWLMHPNCLHAGAPNVGRLPRMVVTQWVAAKG